MKRLDRNDLTLLGTLIAVIVLYILFMISNVYLSKSKVRDYSENLHGILLRNGLKNITWSNDKCKISFERDYSERCLGDLGVAKEVYHFDLADSTVHRSVIDEFKLGLTINHETQLKTANLNKSMRANYSGLGDSLDLKDGTKTKEILDRANRLFKDANLSTFLSREGCNGITTYSVFPSILIGIDAKTETTQFQRHLAYCSKDRG